jgi:hypothetical protein
MAAGATQPADTDTIAFLTMGDTRTERDNYAGSFVRGREWKGGLDGPVFIGLSPMFRLATVAVALLLLTVYM